jgi:lipoprotein LprG
VGFLCRVPDRYLPGMPSTRVWFRRSLAGLALVLAAGCGGGDSAKDPPGGQLLRQAADALRTVTSLSLSLRTEGDPGVSLRSVDAKLLRSGDSQGSVRVSELGMPVQLDFVLIGKTVYLKGLTGGWQRQPLAKVAGIYDPSAVLDPNRGLVQLLRTATGASTRGRDRVAGQDGYRVHATLTQAAVARLVPGIAAATPADIWIAANGHRLLKARLTLPRQGGGDPGTATITFADWGKPFAIRAPAG